MIRVPVSVIMLTLNEEYHLPDAIENVKDWAENIFVVDSYSTDRTVDIALEYEVAIVQHPFKSFGDQWNWALQKLPISTEWTFKLDPDERLSDELKEEIRVILAKDPAYNGFEMDRRLWFMGKPMHVVAPVLRLWRTGKCRFSNVIVNEHPLVEGKQGMLKGKIEHLDSRDMHRWIEKQNQYSTMEAVAQIRGDQLAVEPKLMGTPLERRMFFKKWFFKVPFRYQLQFAHEIFFRGAWRSGRIGWTWAKMRVEIRRWQEWKAKEMKSSNRLPSVQSALKGQADPRIANSVLQRKIGSD